MFFGFFFFIFGENYPIVVHVQGQSGTCIVHQCSQYMKLVNMVLNNVHKNHRAYLGLGEGGGGMEVGEERDYIHIVVMRAILMFH